MVESISEASGSAQGLACANKHRNSILVAYDQLPAPQKGETWYLISSKWWQTHIVHGIPTTTLDNSDIIDPDTKRLKHNLMEGPGNDYVLVDANVWQQVQSGLEVISGSEIIRDVIEESDGGARVEVYPFEFQVRARQMNGTQTMEDWTHVTYSCKASMKSIASSVIQMLKIPSGSDLRWFRRPQESVDSDFQSVDLQNISGAGEEGTTLDQMNVATNDYILVEYKNPYESWIDDMPSMSSTATRRFAVGDIISVCLLEKWYDGRIDEVDELAQKVLVQPLHLPEAYAKFYTFNSQEIKAKNEPLPLRPKAPPSPDSSSSSGSFTRSKRVLEGNLTAGANGTVPVASRLRLGRGIKGLQNLGNTCFMASTLQCLNRTKPFTEYFISKNYARDLNVTNPLGLKGQLAKEYAKLLHEIWFEPPDRPSGGLSSIAPFGIKKVIATHAPMFSGFRQHDSQELLAFLLDGLHEDVNLVTDKPYTTTVESNGRDDEVVAEEAWNTYLARNRSIVVDLFQGQLKSTVVCPSCQRISVTFDPMMYLSLPLTAVDVRCLTVTIIFADVSNKPTVKTLEFPKRGYISDMAAVIGQRTGIRPDQILICEIYANDVIKVFNFSDKISSIQPPDIIFAYETRNEFPDVQPTWVKHAHVSSPDSTMFPTSSSAFFAYPLPVFIPQGTLLSTVHSFVLQAANALCASEKLSAEKLSADDIIIKIIPKSAGIAYNQQVIHTDDASEWSFPSNVPCDIIVHWSAQAHAYKFDNSLNIMTRSLSSQRQSSPDVTLQDCIELFTAEEVLSQQDQWYCSTCKEHRQATKKFELWRLPKILIVHLKRFQYTSYSRSKLDNYVDYPVEGLDLTQFVKGPQRDSPVIYDLYAISNHYGGFGGGHYTAYGKVSENQWYSFDDSSTHPIAVDQIKTRAAYVLFYQLRENADSLA